MLVVQNDTQSELVAAMSWTRMVFLFCFTMVALTKISAQKGLFVKVSAGTGYIKEYTSLKSAGWSIVTKNHAIGWGITDRFALQVGELGGLVKMKVEEYDYVNINGFGLGFNFRIPNDINITVLGASGSVAFAKKWTDPSGDKAAKGYGFNMSIDKEWLFGKRWGFRLGPHFFWFRTTDIHYQFWDAGLNGSIVFYLTPFNSARPK